MSQLDHVINPKYLDKAYLEQLAEQFQTTLPCQHIVLDDFFTEELANTLFEKFPKIDDLKVVRKSFNENKSEDYHFERWDPSFSVVRKALLTDAMNEWMSTLAGIEGLFTNEDALGQGIHQGKDGSFLDVHIDVNVNVAKKLWRRINLLVYLNRDWKDEYGGAIELWNPEMTKLSHQYLPNFNRAVIFLTDENSPHGYEKMSLPEGVTRKSYYAYYYTHLEDGVKYSDSRFLNRPDDSAGRKVVTSFKENLKITAKRLLSKLNITSLDFQDKNEKKDKG